MKRKENRKGGTMDNNAKYDAIAKAHRQANETETILYVIEGANDWTISDRKPLLRVYTFKILEIRPHDGQEYHS